jgi:hypothetical protein
MNRGTLDLTIYDGWRIYTHVGEVANSEIPILKMTVRGWFDPEKWEYEDKDSYTISFCHESTKSEVIVDFRPQFTSMETTMGLDGFGVVFKSNFLDWGWRNERLHQQLRDDIWHRIPWQKKACDWIDSKLKLVSKTRILRMKKR